LDLDSVSVSVSVSFFVFDFIQFFLFHSCSLFDSLDAIIQAVSSKKLLAAKSLALSQSHPRRAALSDDEAQEYALGQRVEVLDPDGNGTTLPGTIEACTMH
jgi:hypothetical protein